MTKSKTRSFLWETLLRSPNWDLDHGPSGLTVYDSDGYMMAHGRDVDEMLEDLEVYLSDHLVESIRKYVDSGLPDGGIQA